MAKEHPFEKLSKGYKSRSNLQAQLQYEEDKVKFLLKRLKLSKLEGELRHTQVLQTNESFLTFDAFNNMFPTFPILLGAVKLKNVHIDSRTQLPTLIKSFESAPFVELYEQFYEQNNNRADKESRLIGLVFPRKGIPSGLIIYATDDLEEIPFSEKELLLTYLSGKGKDRSYIMVRSFGKVLDAIHSSLCGWKS